MTSMRGALVVLVCALAWAAPAQAEQAPLGGGAWSWFGDPRAVTHSGKTFVGWVDLEGDIKVSSYDHATGDRVTAVLQARLNQDDHANPSIHVRPDGKLVIFYSRHVGPAMHYRVSTRPHDVTSWDAPRTVPTNIPGRFGYTYPNPIRLEDEDRTYLFWRGGNYNPTFSVQADGSDGWSPARNLMLMPGERPYTKYASSGGDTIHVAYTNAHPGEFGDVNIYYVRVRDGRIQRAGGQDLGALGDPISPGDGDLVFSERSWVHDVAAGPDGQPVIVFASLPSATDHHYHYARWNGSAWVVRPITAAGGSFRGDGGSPYYSGGLTLDHEDPRRVYLSRQVGPGRWQVEAWTTGDGGSTWSTPQVLTPEPTDKNVRPVSPRGMTGVFGGDLSAIWMRGPYQSWVDYRTAITALSSAANEPPVADAEPAVRSGPAPLEVRFDGSFSQDSDGAIVDWSWNFDDGTGASGREVTHAYTTARHYFPTLTVRDEDGATSTLVEEIVVGLPSVPTTRTGGAAGITAHGAIDPENQPTQWSFEYGPTADYGAVTEPQTLPAADALRQVSAQLPDLVPGRLYHYRLVATNDSGSTEGDDRVMVAGRTPGSDAYRDAVLATPGLTSYWRLGELSGNTAGNDRAGGASGSFLGRFVLGQPGALGALGNPAASFDGASGEMSALGPALSTNATLEGWFRWRAGTTVLRDDSERSGNGWLLAFNSGGNLRYRLGGRDLVTGRPIGLVQDGDWHHLAATKQGTDATLYVDGSVIHSGSGAGAAPATGPWHVMRNGLHEVFSEGEADEIALYTRALTATEVRDHHGRGRELASAPLPPESPAPVDEPPAAGSGPGGGVLGGGTLGGAGAGGQGGAGTGGDTVLGALTGSDPAGRVFVRGASLIVKGAAGTNNRLIARRRGRSWRIADAAARLQAGAGCRRLPSGTIRCRAAGLTRVVLYGGTGDDRLTVLGRSRALLSGGPGDDRLAGGAFARFRGGPGADRVRRLRG